jgi:hypothetical protein
MLISYRTDCKREVKERRKRGVGAPEKAEGVPSCEGGNRSVVVSSKEEREIEKEPDIEKANEIEIAIINC